MRCKTEPCTLSFSPFGPKNKTKQITTRQENLSKLETKGNASSPKSNFEQYIIAACTFSIRTTISKYWSAPCDSLRFPKLESACDYFKIFTASAKHSENALTLAINWTVCPNRYTASAYKNLIRHTPSSLRNSIFLHTFKHRIKPNEEKKVGCSICNLTTP